MGGIRTELGLNHGGKDESNERNNNKRTHFR
jgi:hypothetical protein